MIRSILPGAVGTLAVLAVIPAAAAAPSGRETRLAEVAIQMSPVPAVERDDGPSCSRARRRLWIQGEGWVVRRITTCR